MIFYFTGTGNSLWVAKQIGEYYDEKPISIANELNIKKDTLEYPLNQNENIFFVFPIHSWGPAILALDFIKKINFLGYTNQKVYVICTCGDNCGNTDKIIRKALRKKGITLTQGYSVQMPNNYILMKGFGLDSKEVEKQKLTSAPVLLDKIIENIQTNNNKHIYTRGNLSFLKSYIVYPLFKKIAVKKNKFYAKDNCISCNKCVEVCPVKTIELINSKPQWGKLCVQCTACIHCCPVQAIEYGDITPNMGRYRHPELL